MKTHKRADSVGLCWFMRPSAEEPQEVTDIYVFDHIGYDTPAADFVKELAAITTPRIVLHVNSGGGFIDHALAMYNALTQHPAEIEGRVESVAASAASFLVMGADRVLIAKTARMMIHDAHLFAAGDAAFFRQVVEFLDEQSQNIASIYAERSGIPVDEWRKRMLANDGHGTRYQGQAAVDAGLADAILERAPRPQSLELLRAAACMHADELRKEQPDPDEDDLGDLGGNAQESPAQVTEWAELPPAIRTDLIRKE